MRSFLRHICVLFTSVICISLSILDGKMSFADFLEVMHLQTRAENLPKEVIEAFQAMDISHSGTISTRQLAHMLLHWGEQLSSKEGL